jgi:hypothetical protein
MVIPTESRTPIRPIEVIEKPGDPFKILQGQRRHKTEIPDNIRLTTDSLEFQNKFDNVKDRVLSILKRDVYARKNDLWLMLRYWASMGQIKIIVPLDEFAHINAGETITRARRKIFEEAKKNPDLAWLLTDKEVIEMREQREEQMHDMFAREKTEPNPEVTK